MKKILLLFTCCMDSEYLASVNMLCLLAAVRAVVVVVRRSVTSSAQAAAFLALDFCRSNPMLASKLACKQARFFPPQLCYVKISFPGDSFVRRSDSGVIHKSSWSRYQLKASRGFSKVSRYFNWKLCPFFCLDSGILQCTYYAWF